MLTASGRDDPAHYRAWSYALGAIVASLAVVLSFVRDADPLADVVMLGTALLLPALAGIAGPAAQRAIFLSLLALAGASIGTIVALRGYGSGLEFGVFGVALIGIFSLRHAGDAISVPAAVTIALLAHRGEQPVVSLVPLIVQQVVELAIGVGVAALRERHRKTRGRLERALARYERADRHMRLRDLLTSAFSSAGPALEIAVPPSLRAIRTAAGARFVALVWGDHVYGSWLSPAQVEIHRSKLAAGISMHEVAADVIGREPHRRVYRLSFDSRPIAALAVGGPRPFDSNIVEHAARPALAALLAGAFSAIAERQHEALQRGLALLATAAVGALDARAMLGKVLALIRTQLGVERCLVRLAAPNGALTIFEESVQAGTPALRGTAAFDELPGVTPVVGEIAIVPNAFEGTTATWVTSEQRSRMAACGVRSWMAVAIPCSDAKPGMLAVHQVSRQRRFSPDEIAFLEHACAYVSAALEACRRYDREVETSRMKSDFLANTSHELRTPLHAILGHAELLGRGGLADRSRQHVQSIRDAGTHLLTLVNNLIDLSRLSAGALTLSRRVVDLRDIVESAASVARGAVKDRPVAVRVDWPEHEAFLVDTDPTRVRQILVNLAGNAAKFTERGEIVLGTARRGATVDLSVRDTGRGIDPADHQKIFEKFNPVGASSEAKGAGLGLAIARELAQLLGGTLRVESELGRGALFVLSLPLARTEAHAAGFAS